jgi:hypothetical protein
MNKHRSQADIGKLAYLNRHHLQRELSQPDGAQGIARRLIPSLIARFPDNEAAADVEYVARTLPVLLVRLPYAGLFC